jgi:cell division GTPase FtsZ
MKNREDFLDEAIEELEENDSLLYVDDNDLVKYKHTESEMQKIVNEGCDALYEEYKETDELVSLSLVNLTLLGACRACRCPANKIQ